MAGPFGGRPFSGMHLPRKRISQDIKSLDFPLIRFGQAGEKVDYFWVKQPPRGVGISPILPDFVVSEVAERWGLEKFDVRHEVGPYKIEHNPNICGPELAMSSMMELSIYTTSRGEVLWFCDKRHLMELSLAMLDEREDDGDGADCTYLYGEVDWLHSVLAVAVLDEGVDRLRWARAINAFFIEAANEFYPRDNMTPFGECRETIRCVFRKMYEGV